MIRFPKAPKAALLATAVVAALALPACSSDSGEVDLGKEGALTDVHGVGEVAKLVEDGLAGTWSQPPTSGPKAQQGKSLWIISCGEQVPSCSVPVAAMKEAAETIGWKVHVYDAKLVPANAANGVTEAVAAKADALITIAFGCDVLPAPLRKAKAAGVVMAGFSAFDCDDPLIDSGEPVYATHATFNGIPGSAEQQEAWGALRAAWLIEANKGKAKIVLTHLTGSVLVSHQTAGFIAQVKECADCEIVEKVDLAIADLSSGAAEQKLRTALQQHPDANALSMINDSSFLQFGNKVLRGSAGEKLAVIGGECFQSSTDQIAQGGPQDACAGLPQEWIGWAIIDQLNRQFAEPGSEPADQGLGYQLLDAEHNLPGVGTPWQPEVDFKSAYKSVWGVG